MKTPRLWARWIPAATVTVALGGLSAPGAAQNMPLDRLLAAAEKPSTPTALLKNVKMVIDQRLFERDEFLSDPVLQRLFGSKVDWRDDPPNLKVANLIEFDSIVGPPRRLPATGGFLPGMNIAFIRQYQRKGKTELTIRVGIDRSGIFPSFAGTEEIFGAGWQLVMPFPNPHSMWIAPTGPHGNDVIEYANSSNGIERKLTLTFAPDGTLSYLYFDEIL